MNCGPAAGVRDGFDVVLFWAEWAMPGSARAIADTVLTQTNLANGATSSGSVTNFFIGWSNAVLGAMADADLSGNGDALTASGHLSVSLGDNFFLSLNDTATRVSQPGVTADTLQLMCNLIQAPTVFVISVLLLMALVLAGGMVVLLAGVLIALVPIPFVAMGVCIMTWQQMDHSFVHQLAVQDSNTSDDTVEVVVARGGGRGNAGMFTKSAGWRGRFTTTTTSRRKKRQ